MTLTTTTSATSDVTPVCLGKFVDHKLSRVRWQPRDNVITAQNASHVNFVIGSWEDEVRKKGSLA